MASSLPCSTVSTIRLTFMPRYGGDNVAIDIRTLQVLEGRIPPRALGLVVEWASQHQDELMQDWELARREQQPRKIEPLG